MIQPQQPTKKPTDTDVAGSILRLAADWETIPDMEVKAIVKAVMAKAGMPVHERKEGVAVMFSKGESNEAHV